MKLSSNERALELCQAIEAAGCSEQVDAEHSRRIYDGDLETAAELKAAGWTAEPLTGASAMFQWRWRRPGPRGGTLFLSPTMGAHRGFPPTYRLFSNFTVIVHLDYEARSGVDISDVGSHRFSIDPRFEIFFAAARAEGSDRVLLWVNPLFRVKGLTHESEEAERVLAQATLVYAHNANNEQANTWGAITQSKACPFKTEPPLAIWRCTAAMSRKAGLPNALEDVAEALNLAEQKDKRGKKLIDLFCSPEEETGIFADPHCREKEFIEFGEYCRQDVRTEVQVHQALKQFELSGAMLATFQFDLRMNQRGIPINVHAARNAQKIIDREQAGVALEFRKRTGLNPTQKKKFLPWYNEKHDRDLPNLQAATVDAEIEYLTAQLEHAGTSGYDDELVWWSEPLELLQLYQKVSYAAVAKIAKMLECVCPDDRVRGAMFFYGAGTGRWASKLLQAQNFKRTPKWLREFTDEIYALICRGTTSEVLDAVYGDPLELISGCIRHFIQALGPLLDGDFAQVEARIICWLAGQDDILEMWRAGRDLYKWMASHVYGIPEDQVDSDQREVGKRIILGAGFQMGPDKFQSSCKTQYQLDLPIELCEKGIKLFRALCKKIRDYWYYLNDRALEAVRVPGVEFGPFKIRTVAGIPFLMFRLRSGRCLSYPHPQIELVPYTPKKYRDEFGEEIQPGVQWRENVTYWGQVPGKGYWGRIKLYGGKLAENETQATAADFMAYGGIEAERRGMEPFMLVHDQGLAEVNGHTVEEYESALGTLPNWARGFPMKVEAKICPYYKK